jgi:hypothetical protein
MIRGQMTGPLRDQHMPAIDLTVGWATAGAYASGVAAVACDFLGWPSSLPFVAFAAFAAVALLCRYGSPSPGDDPD